MSTHFISRLTFLSTLIVTLPGISRSEVTLDSAVVDNRDITFSGSPQPAPPPLRVSSSTRSIGIRFHDETRPGGEPLRLRYKLEGVDPEWRDLDSEMAVWLRLIDKQGVVVSGDSLSLRGETPGWTGRAENTPLQLKTISFTAPGAAEGIWVFFISNGGREVLGQMIAGDISIRILRPTDGKGQDISLDCTTESKTPKPLDLPTKWTREGERPDIAQILSHPGLDSGSALFLNDNDPDKFGVWRSRPVNIPLKAGDRVILRWKTAYSIGKGGQGMASYSGLKPGNYWFRVITVHHNGLPTGNEISLPIVILPPIYQRPASWLFALAALSGLTVLVTRRITKKRMMARLQTLERQRILESERTRIARDIHDDLGATLAQVAMLSEMARAEAGDPQIVGELLGDIFTRAQSATRSLDEIVWAIKPENDRPEYLIRYLGQFAENYLTMAGLRFRLDAPENLPQYILTSAQRHNLFLAAKEALHNIVKHARATEVWIRVGMAGKRLTIRIEDNGTGQVPPPDAPPTRGSANMKNRMEQIGGRYARTGAPGCGTVVELTLPMEGPSS